MKQKIMNFIEARRAERNRRLFESLMKDPSSGIPKMVNDIAQEKALGYVMNWLNNKRIRHCAMCPSTEQLHAHGIHYLCPIHHDYVERLEAKQKLESAGKAAA
jgi:hypothetical protein